MNSCRHFGEVVVSYFTPVFHNWEVGTAAGSMLSSALMSLNPLLCCVNCSGVFKNVLNSQPGNLYFESKHDSK